MFCQGRRDNGFADEDAAVDEDVDGDGDVDEDVDVDEDEDVDVDEGVGTKEDRIDPIMMAIRTISEQFTDVEGEES